jgi:hypothetical protein
MVLGLYPRLEPRFLFLYRKNLKAASHDFRSALALLAHEQLNDRRFLVGLLSARATIWG